MSLEETTRQCVDNLLDFHISMGMDPSQFLTWGNLTGYPTLLMDRRLDGLDWDTIPGFFDRVDAVKTTLIDLDIATIRWMQ